MQYLAMVCLLLGGVLCYNGYQTLHNPLPQYTAKYGASPHRGIALAVLLAGIFLCCVGVFAAMAAVYLLPAESCAGST
jgi:hypothetical protein